MSTLPPPPPEPVASPPPGDPALECDLVMKGGITSGLVYPPAILKLAERYRFRGIGGASAGAIGAAAAAAAEFGRATGGFERLAALRTKLESRGFMLELFQPSPATRPLFAVILALKPSFDASAALAVAQADARAARAAASHVADVAGGAGAAIALAIDATVRAAEAAASEAETQAAAAARAARKTFAARTVADAEEAASLAVGASAKASLAAAEALAADDAATLAGARAGVPTPLLRSAPGELPPAPSSLASTASWLPRIDRAFAATFPATHRWGRVAGFGAGAVVASFFVPYLLLRSAGFTAVAILGAASTLALGVWIGGFAAGARQVWKALQALSTKEDSFFGFCSGSRGAAAPAPAEGESIPLTDWLHAGINALVGRGFDAPPLTIGELAEKTIPDGSGGVKHVGITFQMVTTNLSQAQPCVFPTHDGSFVFARADMERFFPRSVVDLLVAPPAARGSVDEVVTLPAGFHFLPAGGALPVVVATRLSLSFPVLLSALRLYSVKGTAFEVARAYHAKAEKPYALDLARDLEESWFSDGGIAANFPLSIFDAWVPVRPTFGIDLCDAPTANRVPRPTKSDPVILPRAGERDDTLARPAPIPGLVGFFLAMLDTARSARDNAQADMASYRERVAKVYLAPDEGGLNLAMSDDAVSRIAGKGTRAAGLFIDKFSPDEHLWVRTRLLMSHLEQEFANVRIAYGAPDGSLQPLRDRFQQLFATQLAAKGGDRFYRPREEAWCTEAMARIGGLVSLMDAWHAAQPRWVAANADLIAKNPALREAFFHADPPAPDGALRVTSRI